MGVASELLHTHRFGPSGSIQLLAIHGLTGHGKRWKVLADYAPQLRFLAPDLLGHGYSSWDAPWTIDANVAALAQLLESTITEPVVVVGHSFGGAIALRLAADHPGLISGVILLDPAVGLDGRWVAHIASSMLESYSYATVEDARQEKCGGAWCDVSTELVDREIRDHLMVAPRGGYQWRMSIAAVMSYWSELTRPPAWPVSEISVTVVRATKTQPPYVTSELLDGLADRLHDRYELLQWPCHHMVAQVYPDRVAALVERYVSQ